MSEKTIIDVLSKIQKELKTPKTKFNSFGKYYYRSLEDIMCGLKDIMPPDAALLVSDELILIGDRYYIKATATLHYKNDKLSAYGWAREALTKKGSDDCQITGGASSYSRKYALAGLFSIDDSEVVETHDSDATNTHDQGEAGTDLHTVSIANAIKEMCKEDNMHGAASVTGNLNETEKRQIWELLSATERDWLKTMAARMGR